MIVDGIVYGEPYRGFFDSGYKQVMISYRDMTLEEFRILTENIQEHGLIYNGFESLKEGYAQHFHGLFNKALIETIPNEGDSLSGKMFLNGRKAELIEGDIFRKFGVNLTELEPQFE